MLLEKIKQQYISKKAMFSVENVLPMSNTQKKGWVIANLENQRLRKHAVDVRKL